MKIRVLTSIVVLRAWTIAACQCGTVPSPRDALKRADAVFTGTVVTRTPILLRVGGDLIVAEHDEFLVHTTWRGTSAPRVTLLQGLNNCSYHFQVGAQYLVFAHFDHQSPADLTSSICFPTQTLLRASAALSELGAPLMSGPASLAGTEHRIRRAFRHGYASALCGAALLRAHFRVLRDSYGSFNYLYVLGPGAILISAAVLALCLLTRRRKLAARIALPLLLLTALSITLEGYLYLCRSPILGLPGFEWYESQ